MWFICLPFSHHTAVLLCTSKPNTKCVSLDVKTFSALCVKYMLVNNIILSSTHYAIHTHIRKGYDEHSYSEIPKLAHVTAETTVKWNCYIISINRPIVNSFGEVGTLILWMGYFGSIQLILGRYVFPMGTSDSCLWSINLKMG